MPLILPGNVASATAAVGFSIDNSCRWNDGDSPQMTMTPSAGSLIQHTLSFWVKRCTLGTDQAIVSVHVSDATTYAYVRFDSDDRLDFYNFLDGGYNGWRRTNRKFRDVSAWYHIVTVWDTAATAADRMIVYVNGVRETSFETSNTPGVNANFSFGRANEHQIGSYNDSDYFDGYLAEMFMCNDEAYDADDFGEFDEDSPTIWKPKDCFDDLTFGTGGFYLDFEDSDNLGDDESGNGTDFAEVNIAAADQATDTPTNNFCTMNPLDNYLPAATFSEGNCYIVTGSSSYTWSTGTIALTKGRWYFEMKVVSAGTQNWQGVGVADHVSTANNVTLGFPSGSDSWGYFGFSGGSGGPIYNDGADQASSSNTYTTNDIIGVFVDLTSNKIYFSKNGTLETGTGWSLTASASTAYGHYFPAIADYLNSASATLGMNFGGCPAFALSSAVADANGYGNFEYDPSYGGAASFDSAAKDFLAICTKNLATDG